MAPVADRLCVHGAALRFDCLFRDGEAEAAAAPAALTPAAERQKERMQLLR